jgi:hypothetical protein
LSEEESAIEAKKTARQELEEIAEEAAKDAVDANVDSLDDYPKRKLEEDIWDFSQAIKEIEGLARQ